MTDEIIKAGPAKIQQNGTGFDMLPINQIIAQTQAIQQLMAQGMIDGTHYGKIPGCGDKPALLQPGAQKLMLLFGLADDYEIDQTDLPNGHREYRVKCRLISKSTGTFQGSGNGLCTTMETKYRYRGGDFEVTDEPIPKDAKQKKSEYRKKGFGMQKVDGVWCWVKYKQGKIENPDIADTYNTVLKMATKRALVAAILNTLAASDMFTQDVEDFQRQQPQPQTQQPPQEMPPYDMPPESVAWDDAPAQNGPQRQNPPANPPRERPAYLDPLRAILREAKGLGWSIRELQAEVENELGCEVEAMGPDMVADAVAYVQNKITPDDDGLLDHDIEF